MANGRYQKNQTFSFKKYDLDRDGHRDTVKLQIWGKNDSSIGMKVYTRAKLSVNRTSKTFQFDNTLFDLSLQLITLDNGHSYLYLLGHQKGWNAPVPSLVFSYSGGKLVKKYDLSGTIKRKINGYTSREFGEIVKADRNNIYVAVSGDSKPAFYTLKEKNGKLALKKGPSSLSLAKPRVTSFQVSSPQKGTVKVQWKSDMGNSFEIQTSNSKSFSKILESFPVSDPNQKSMTIKGKSGRKLYCRIRACRGYILWGTDGAWKAGVVTVK